MTRATSIWVLPSRWSRYRHEHWRIGRASRTVQPLLSCQGAQARGNTRSCRWCRGSYMVVRSARSRLSLSFPEVGRQLQSAKQMPAISISFNVGPAVLFSVLRPPAVSPSTSGTHLAYSLSHNVRPRRLVKSLPCHCEDATWQGPQRYHLHFELLLKDQVTKGICLRGYSSDGPR